MDYLEVLQRKVRQRGYKVVRDLWPELHTNKFNAVVAGNSPITPEFQSIMRLSWPEEFSEGTGPENSQLTYQKEGANQLHFCMLSPVQDTYEGPTVDSIVGITRRTLCGWMRRGGDSEIARSRNMLVRDFLKTDYEWSYWIDADMVAPNGASEWFKKSVKSPGMNDDFAGIIAPYKLASWGKTIVSGVYFSRHGSVQITAGFNPGTSLKNKMPCNGLIPVRYSGMGCMMVHRKVYEDMCEKFPDLNPEGSSESGFFSEFWDKEAGRMWGEDEAFCMRAKECGHETYLDTGVVCGHIGKKTFFIPEGPIT